MNPRSIQLTNEVRPLALPWILIMLGGVVTLIPISRIDYSWSPIDLLNWILPLGCFVGIPLLAALPLGNEFQHRTFALLLAQPIDRHSLWLRKMLIALAAVLPASALYLFSFHKDLDSRDDFWMAAVWIVAASAGSIAGTLIARSAIGGLALSCGFYGIGFVTWSRLADSYRKNGEISSGFLWATAVVLICYATVLVFIGRRMFLRYQAADGIHSTNDLASHARFLPQFISNWLRSRPRGAILNLIRREFHLLRIVWLLTLFSFFTWTCLALFHLVRTNADEFGPEPLAAGLAVILSFLIAVLAGSLSLGEERNWGTHAWQLTMPISPSTQWAVKLVFALSASAFCAVAVPLGVLITRGWISGSPYSFLDHDPLWLWFVEALVATLAAFWCSCVVKGTVRAVLLCFPMLVALGLAGVLGQWMAYTAIVRWRLLIDAVTARVDPFRATRLIAILFNPPGYWWALVVVAPLLAVGLIQSHRMFRAQTEGRKLHTVRSMLPLFATVVFLTFLLGAVSSLAWQLWSEQGTIVREAHLAIETLEASGDRANLLSLQKFTMDDLAKASSLSNTTQHWLRDCTIIVRPETDSRSVPLPLIQWPYERAFLADGAPEKQAISYSATIRTSRGSECNLHFRTLNGGKNGFLSHSCQ
jgi:ABC-type transport system involved in multi-copper enzyme maturation permease subunit